MPINYANVVALTKTKVASLGAGMASSRTPAKFHSRPWSDTTEEALLSSKPGHRGRSPSPMGETATKAAFNSQTMRTAVQGIGKIPQMFNSTQGLRNTVQGINKIPGAVGGAAQKIPGAIGGAAQKFPGAVGGAAQSTWNTMKAHPRAVMGTGAALGGVSAVGLGANAMHNSYATGARNKLMDAMGGEGQVRSLLGGVGIDVPEGQAITEAHIGQAATKLREMQQGGMGGMMGQLGQWWQGLDPQMQQALISVPAGVLLGGFAGGMPGAMIGGGLGAAVPYASPYAMNWMRQQGLMQPQATN